MQDATSIDIALMPDLARLVEDVCSSGQVRVLRRANEDVALLTPLSGPAPPVNAEEAANTQNDSLWDIVGFGESDELEDVATHRGHLLTNAARPEQASHKDVG